MTKILKINYGFVSCEDEIELVFPDDATKEAIDDLAYTAFRDEVLSACHYELVDPDNDENE